MNFALRGSPKLGKQSFDLVHPGDVPFVSRGYDAVVTYEGRGTFRPRKEERRR